MFSHQRKDVHRLKSAITSHKTREVDEQSGAGLDVEALVAVGVKRQRPKNKHYQLEKKSSCPADLGRLPTAVSCDVLANFHKALKDSELVRYDNITLHGHGVAGLSAITSGPSIPSAG
jgi:hypothetical protein